MLIKSDIFIVTNNSKVFDKYRYDYRVEFIESDNMLSVLIKVRDYMHIGYTLLTHPLSGSLKPNQTPYKSILLIDNNVSFDFDKLRLIENSIESFDKFVKNNGIAKWNDKIKDDFKTVDLSLIDFCVQKNVSLFL